MQMTAMNFDLNDGTVPLRVTLVAPACSHALAPVLAHLTTRIFLRRYQAQRFSDVVPSVSRSFRLVVSLPAIWIVLKTFRSRKRHLIDKKCQRLLL